MWRLGYWSDEIGTVLITIAGLAFLVGGEYVAAAVLWAGERLREALAERKHQRVPVTDQEATDA